MKHTIENRYMSIVFDDELTTITSLYNHVTGDETIKYGRSRQPQPLFKLYTMEHESASGVRSERLPGSVLRTTVVVEPDTGLRRLSIELDGGVRGTGTDTDAAAAAVAAGDANGETVFVDARVLIELEAEACESVWRLELANRDPRHDIVEVIFPYVGGLALGETWEDDTLIYPHHAGEKTDNPVRQYASDKYRNFWRAESVLEADGTFSREINYCGLASMTWMYLYDHDNGLYLGSHDERFPLTGLRVETGGPADPWMGFGFRKYTVIREGEIWSSGEAVIALTDQDWRWGSKRYRKWIDKHIGMPDNPPFLNSEYILNQCYNFKRETGIANRFENIPAMFDSGKQEYDMDHMFIASWNRKGFDRDYPEFQPDMELGTPWELYQGCQAVNRQGGFVTFYINARIFDTAHDFFPTMGTRWAIKNHKHDMMRETYGPVEFTVTCPSNKEWQDYLIDMSRWMVSAYGATGIYLDQLGSADPYPCYDPMHSHGDIGEFNTGYLRVLRELQPELRRLNPNSFLMIENCGDIYGSYVWGSLTWNGENYDEFYNLFKYTFPEYVQVNMVNPRHNLEGKRRVDQQRWDIARALLIGSVFWLGVHRLESLDTVEMKPFTKQAVRLRKELQPYIQQGVYLDTEGVLSVSEGIDIAHWKLDNGAELYIIANLQQREGAFFEVSMSGATSTSRAAISVSVSGDDLEGSWEVAGGRARETAAYSLSAGRLRVAVSASALSFRLVSIQ
jgi:hypothetical protein